MTETEEVPTCEICNAPMEWERCWTGCIDGWVEFTDDESEFDEQCDECEGTGGYWQCTALPHTDEQMEAWREERNL